LGRSGIDTLLRRDRVSFEPKPGKGGAFEATNIAIVERDERPEGPRPEQRRRDGVWTLPGEDEV
jgi:hypothetical protein